MLGVLFLVQFTILTALWASIGVMFCYSSRPFSCPLDVYTFILPLVRFIILTGLRASIGVTASPGLVLRFKFKKEADEHEKRGRPGLIHHMSDVMWT